MWASQNKSAVLLAILAVPVSVSFAGTLWISTRPIGPLYFLDLLVIITALIFLFVGKLYGFSDMPSQARLGIVVLCLVPIFSWLRLINGDVTPDTLRDAYPFIAVGYSAGFLAGASMIEAKFGGLASQLVLWGLGIHWVRITVSMIASEMSLGLPEFWSDFLEIRADIDSAVMVIFSGVAWWLAQSMTQAKKMLFRIFSVVLLVQVGFLESRAGIVAGVLAIGAVFLLETLALKSQVSGLRKWTAVALGGLLRITVLMATPSASKLVAIGEPLVSPSTSDPIDEAFSRFGTVEARLNAWNLAVEWLTSDVQRFLFGVGFGTDWFVESGAGVALMGSAAMNEGANRWPHNFLITAAAGMGVFVAIFFLILLLLSIFGAFQGAYSNPQSLSSIALITLVALGTVSLFGVVLENPFGMVPISWAIGVGLGHRGTPR